MRIRSTDLVLWLKKQQRLLSAGERVTARLSKDALRLYNALSMEGCFPDFLMTREYKSGLVHLVKVR